MKVCPQCKNECRNEDSYCPKCRYNLGGVPVVADRKKRKSKHVSTGAGCLIIIIAALVVAVLAIFLPGMFSGESKGAFGEGFRKLIPTGRSIIERVDIDISLPPRF